MVLVGPPGGPGVRLGVGQGVRGAFPALKDQPRKTALLYTSFTFSCLYTLSSSMYGKSSTFQFAAPMLARCPIGNR